MKLTIFAFIVVLFSYSQGNTQTTEKLRTINLYAEVGPYIYGVPLSLNLDTEIIGDEKNQLYGRFGAGFGGEIFGPTGPGGLVALGYLRGSGKHHLEFDSGVFLGRDKFDGAFPLFIADLGYRFQKPEGGLIIKVKVGFAGFGAGLGYAF